MQFILAVVRTDAADRLAGFSLLGQLSSWETDYNLF
jgi:hypothetical protein